MPVSAKIPFGVVELDDGGGLAGFVPFGTDPQEAAARFSASPENMLPAARQHIRSCGRRLFGSEKELNRFISQFAAALSRQKLGSRTGRDKFIIYANSALEDMDKTVNAFLDRLSEWFTLHYPEHQRSKKELLDAVLEFGTRERFPRFSASIGIPMDERDVAALRIYASAAKQLDTAKRELERYVAASMKEIAPNVSAVIDPLLGAKLLALAGSLERLARLPASAIQLLGAEKALFRHLKKQGKSPKYGILYLDARIQRAPKENRGKAARLIASKVMIAARVDHYSGRYEERFKRELVAELQAIA